MANHHFGLNKLLEYLKQMDVKIASVDKKREMIELSYHGTEGQWQMIVSLHQSGSARNLMLRVPYFGSVTVKNRPACLEALLAANYRIFMGHFCLDMDDGEVLLEATIPVAAGTITQEQFELVYWSLMLTVVKYHSLLHRIIYGNMTAQEALLACEQEFDAEMKRADESASQELNVQDVFAELKRILDEPHE